MRFERLVTETGHEWLSSFIPIDAEDVEYGGTGHFSPALIGFSPRAQRVIVEQTHRRGLVAETHSTTSEALRVSVLAGLDLIQHPEVLPTEIPDELVELIKERDVLIRKLSLVMKEGRVVDQESLPAKPVFSTRQC